MAETTSKTFKGCYNCGTLIDTASKYCGFCGAGQYVAGTYQNIQDSTVAKATCSGCGETVDREDARFCPVCGHELVHDSSDPSEIPKSSIPAPVQAPMVPVVPTIKAPSNPLPPGYVLNSKGKKVHRITAGVLALLLGSVGAHWFYIGKPALGVLSILTSWTGIPALVGFIHGIVYLTSTDEHFKAKYLP